MLGLAYGLSLVGAFSLFVTLFSVVRGFGLMAELILLFGLPTVGLWLLESEVV